MFPTKVYGDMTFPAGEYEALRVDIGKAEGKNWWCVMFPPLCFVDGTYSVVPDSSKKELQNMLTDKEYSSLFTDDDVEVKIRFKFLDDIIKFFS
jgi:stage II sporulation protein R